MYDAVTAFLRGAPPAPPFFESDVGSYRALCLPDGAEEAPVVLLLAGEDGAVYAPAGLATPADLAASADVATPITPPADGAAPPLAPSLADLPDVLQRARLRPTGSALTVRLPASPGGTSPGIAHFTLWASPAYRAAGGGTGGVWK